MANIFEIIDIDENKMFEDILDEKTGKYEDSPFKSCYDTIMYDDVDSKKYLSEDEKDNVLLIKIIEGNKYYVACYSRTNLKKIIKRRTEPPYLAKNCKRADGRNEVFYPIVIGSENCFFTLESIRNIIISAYQIYYVEEVEMINCQGNKNKLYTVKVCGGSNCLPQIFGNEEEEKEVEERDGDYIIKTKYHPNGDIKSTIWYKNGKKHRENGNPAVIKYYEDGNKQYEGWYINDILHHEIKYYEDGNKQYEGWYKNNMLDRETEYYPNGNVQKTSYYNSSRELNSQGRDNPSYISYYQNGMEEYKRWHKNGKLHRERDQPAEIEYYKNVDQKRTVSWWTNGERHREGNKPAIIKYYQDGRKESESWWRNGNMIREIYY